MVVKPISTQVSADTRPREDAHDERDEQSFDLLAYWRILAIRKWSILGLSLAITVLVVAAKYFNFGYPPVTPLLMSDPTRSLLIALALAFISKWV